jgi:hypothetical protein
MTIALRIIAGVAVATGLALGAAPLAAASAAMPSGGADPYVPSGTNPMVPYGADAAQIYGPNPFVPFGTQSQ